MADNIRVTSFYGVMKAGRSAYREMGDAFLWRFDNAEWYWGPVAMPFNCREDAEEFRDDYRADYIAAHPKHPRPPAMAIAKMGVYVMAGEEGNVNGQD